MPRVQNRMGYQKQRGKQVLGSGLQGWGGRWGGGSTALTNYVAVVLGPVQSQKTRPPALLR